MNEEKILSSAGSGSVCSAEVELCDKCGEALGKRAMAIYDGENWQTVHASCASVE